MVGDKFRRCKEIGLTYLQAEVSIESTMSRLRDDTNMTKKETGMLPKLSRDKKTAYLKYPVGRKLWVSQNVDYEKKYWSTMLLNHLDSKALERIIALEKDHDRAMAALD